MEKFYRNYWIANIIVWVATAIFLALQFWNEIFRYFAVGTAVIAFVLIGTYQLFKYKDLKKKIADGYDVYLAEYYRDGFITKNQLINRAPELYPEYKRLYKKDKSLRIGLFIFFFALAVVLTAYLLKVLL